MNTPPLNLARRRWEKIILRWQELRQLPEPMRDRAQQTACGDQDWFALLRLIQNAHPEFPRLGYGLSPKGEPVRLGQPLFFHPPPTTLAELAERGPSEKAGVDFTPPDDDAPTGPGKSPSVTWVYSHHLGMFGPHGPLPLHLTDYAYRRVRDQDGAFFAFCNALTHRFLCFFFRAWAEARKEMTAERIGSLTPTGQPFARKDIGEHGEEWWSFFVGALIGSGLDSLRSRDRVAEKAKLFYSGRLLQIARNAEGLRAIVQDYFGLPTRIVEFQPRTLPIPPSAQWHLGSEANTGQLGFSTLVGTKVEDYQSGFRVRLGPLSLEELERFLPGADGFGQMHVWLRFYCGKETDPNPDADVPSGWDLQLVLRAPEVPPLALDRNAPARLGWTTWMFAYSPFFSSDQIKDSGALAGKFRRHEDKVSEFLFQRFSGETRTLLQSRTPDASILVRLETALMNEFNKVVVGDSIYDAARFAGVTLAEETRKLLEGSPASQNIRRLNRALIEDAYPNELYKNRATPNDTDAEDVVLEPLPYETISA